MNENNLLQQSSSTSLSIDNIFFKVWRNYFLKFKIFQYLKDFNNHLYIDFIIDSNDFNDGIKKLKIYKFKEYIRSIVILINREIDNEDNSDVSNFINSLPSFIERLTLKFNESLLKVKPINQYKIPNHIKELIIQFPNLYKHEKMNLSHLKELKVLEFSNFNGNTQKDSFPNSLVSLKFCNKFERHLEFTYIQSLKYLDLGHGSYGVKENEVLNNVNLECVKGRFYISTNRPQKNNYPYYDIYASYLPLNVKKFDWIKGIVTFNKRENFINNNNNTSTGDYNIKTIKYTSWYFYSLCKDDHTIVPESVTKLVISIQQRIPFYKNMFPNGLLYLKVDSTQGNLISSNFIPPKLKSFYGISSLRELKLLPSHVKTIGFCNNFDCELSQNDDIPKHITSLSFGKSFLQTSILHPNVFKLNLDLKYLRFNTNTTQGIYLSPGSLPSNLKYLEFGYDNYLKPITFYDDLILPQNLTVLVLPNSFKVGGNFVKLPQSLRVLKFSIQNEQNQLFNNNNNNNNKEYEDNYIKLPESITVLSVGHNDNQFNTIDISSILPKSLKVLIINDKSLLYGLNNSNNTTQSLLPNSLKTIYTSNNFLNNNNYNLNTTVYSLLTIVKYNEKNNNSKNDLKLLKKIINLKI